MNNSSLLSLGTDLSASFISRKRGWTATGGTTMTGILYKKKGNASLFKITSVIKDGKTPEIWKEREFSISEEGIFSYSKPNKKSPATLDLREAVLRLASPLQDQYGGFHVHFHTFDGAPYPYTFEIGLKIGIEANWSLCAK